MDLQFFPGVNLNNALLCSYGVCSPKVGFLSPSVSHLKHRLITQFELTLEGCIMDCSKKEAPLKSKSDTCLRAGWRVLQICPSSSIDSRGSLGDLFRPDG